MNKKNTVWSIPVSLALDEAVENAVVKDMHSTKSDLVREAVREKLEKMRQAKQIE